MGKFAGFTPFILGELFDEGRLRCYSADWEKIATGKVLSHLGENPGV